MKNFSENQQYNKFLLLIEVLPAMIVDLLQRAGDQGGPVLSLELDRVVSHGNVIF
jgi:hypothetical protein